LNSSFNILTPGADTTESSLIVEMSNQGISYVAINESSTCIALACYFFEAGTTIEKTVNNLKDIFAAQPFLQKTFKKINFIYAFSQAELVPQKLMNADAARQMMELIYGDTAEYILRNDFMYRHNMYNLYLVPKQADALVTHLFAQANHFHLYSLLPIIAKSTGNFMYCIFSTTQVTVQLFKSSGLQLIKSFPYKTPEDVAYHLLNTCQYFQVPVNDTSLVLNGMIDAESVLYNELYKYFADPGFAVLPELFTYSDDIKKFPAHYFSHLFELAACV
jgi:Protein of unknown function (DUF3822)